MRDYEVVYIFSSQLEEEEVESKLDSYHEQITGEGSGEITAVEDWGKRQLAYPIEDQENGHYVVVHFSVEPEQLDEFERVLKLDGDLLRYLVVLHEEELPTPPSARRPGAGPDEEDEEGEEADAETEASESEESEEDEPESDEAAEEDEDEGGDEDADEESDEESDEGSDEETADDEESGEEPGDEEAADGESDAGEEPGEDESEDEETEEETSEDDEESDDEDEEKE